MENVADVWWVVPDERHLDRLPAQRRGAETRASLLRRLLEALAPSIEIASPAVLRMALAVGIEKVASDDELLGPIARTGGGAWQRTLDTLHGSIGRLRMAGTSDGALARAALEGGTSGRRAAALLTSVRALDGELARAELGDPRRSGRMLARAIATAGTRRVVDALDAPTVIARGLMVWEPDDLVWWRALDAVLSERGGEARIEVPSFDLRLDPTRERDPFELIAEDVARGLDAAPHAVRIAAALGDLSLRGTPPADARDRVELHACANARAQAQAVAFIVARALANGTPIERLAVAVTHHDSRAVHPISEALGAAGIIAYAGRGPPAASRRIVACALEALTLGADGLPRAEVARLLRSHT